MYTSQLNELEERFEELTTQVENLEGDYEQDVYDFELQVFEIHEQIENDYNQTNEQNEKTIVKQLKSCKALINKITTLKKENEFYDAEAELDNMFPDRHDPDFDQDSMSYDSVFGDD